LKSDQNGIERKTIEEAVAELVELKSDQNGIERLKKLKKN